LWALDVNFNNVSVIVYHAWRFSDVFVIVYHAWRLSVLLVGEEAGIPV